MTGIEEAIGAAIFSAISASEIGATVVVGSVTANVIVGSVVLTAGLEGLSYGLQALIAPSAPKPSPGEVGQPFRSGIGVRWSGYGICRLPAQTVLYENVSGSRLQVFAVHHGRICGFFGYFLDQDRVSVDGSGYVTGVLNLDGTNLASGGGNNDGRYLANCVRILSRTGEIPETAYAEITSRLAGWDSNHRGDGVASLGVICTNPPIADLTKRFPSGYPGAAPVCGCAPLWDPRDVDADPDDPDTWFAKSVYDNTHDYAAGDYCQVNRVVFRSRVDGNIGHPPILATPLSIMEANQQYWVNIFANPVLQYIHYASFADGGLKARRDLLITPVLDALKDEADYCEELVDLASGGKEPRYQSAGYFSLTDPPSKVLGSIGATCDMWTAPGIDGSYHVKVGRYVAPTVTIGEKDIIVAGSSVQRLVRQDDRVNELTLTYTDAAQGYTSQAADPWRDNADISDRGLCTKPIDLPWVQSARQARYLAQIAMDRAMAPARGGAKGVLVLRRSRLDVLGERFVIVNWPARGLVNQPVEILDIPTIDLVGAEPLKVEFVTIDPTARYAWSTASEGTNPSVPATVNQGTFDAPQHLSGTAEGSVSTGFYLYVSVDDPSRADWSYIAEWRVADTGSGSPGTWNDVPITSPIITGGRVYMSVPVTVSPPIEVQVAFINAAVSRSPWSSIILLRPTTNSTDFSLPQNSGYLMPLMLG